MDKVVIRISAPNSSTESVLPYIGNKRKLSPAVDALPIV
jgi:hypothetical protein